MMMSTSLACLANRAISASINSGDISYNISSVGIYDPILTAYFRVTTCSFTTFWTLERREMFVLELLRLFTDLYFVVKFKKFCPHRLNLFFDRWTCIEGSHNCTLNIQMTRIISDYHGHAHSHHVKQVNFLRKFRDGKIWEAWVSMYIRYIS